ncbi:23S rRNA (guanine(1835)-N(2))-methyltransferase RlmG [Acerihabitans arboris]|uniref:Ribosomal RNA large subunit methyltransferase G n=1 Tax=Acerihabitans arboris TaxID=2691583 RepID=A0A845SKR2_9GAMM|nr:23S rRNA (guanine(1835)-N(2))-methyltransferase RlmG [Acerihabitans arboris]NDL63586.1 23S rRNA (guanine(1835)-N(2))-methyltransferase RlmG [Acerihabitans arboris]
MSRFDYASGVLELDRYPPGAADGNLQAWDAADEYLLAHVATLGAITGPTLIFNDSFGALACALRAGSPYSIGDSFLSQLATRHNAGQNATDDGEIRFLDSLAPLPASPGLVLMKIPKTLALLEHQLYALRRVSGPGTQVIAAGKVRDIHNSTLQRFSDILGSTRTSLAKKKARLIFSQVTAPAVNGQEQSCVWPLEENGYLIHNHANVFSRATLDIGARFFMQYLPEGLDGTLIDLGCGNGVLGLTALGQNPRAGLHFIDESYMAIASSRINIATNRPDDMARCRFVVGNSLVGYDADSVQAVLCNPPFHQQQVLTDHIARGMFRDAKRSLRPGGELRIVANRHLDYYHQIKQLFGNCATLGSNPKFVVLRAVKT